MKGKTAEYWRATMENAEIVPSDTLQGVILARVDGLEPTVKEILQVASVVGESFVLPLLEGAAKSAGWEKSQKLNSLSKGGRVSGTSV